MVVEVINPVCGDILRLSALVEDGRITRSAFKTRGCTASIAASSALTELITGKTAAELSRITREIVEEAVGGLMPESGHAAALAVDGIRALIARM
jgi:NifU-like protein involved in Fe-S cluster formation